MVYGLVQFEAEIQSLNQIRSRVIYAESDGPWVEGRGGGSYGPLHLCQLDGI
jgi:hypothetical protein